MDPGKLLLRKGKINKNGVNGLQRNNRFALIENLSQINQADAEPSGKRCPDGFFGDGRPDGVGASHTLFILGLGVIVLGLSNGPPIQQLFQALEITLGQLHAGLRRSQLSFFRGGILLNQQVAGIHFGTRLKSDAHDFAGQFGGQRYALNRHE